MLGTNSMAFFFKGKVIGEKWMCCMLLYSLYLRYEDVKINNQEGCTRTEQCISYCV